MYDGPEIGKIITIVTDWSDVVETSMPSVQAVYGQNTITGTVVKNEDFDDPASFNITTGNPHFPIANIALHRVISLKYSEGNDAVTVDEIDGGNEMWIVSGSKGREYVVTRKGNTWSCECKGWEFRSQCKHVNEKKTEVLERKK